MGLVCRLCGGAGLGTFVGLGKSPLCTFRDHLILEYEVPKYDGDLGSPTVFVPLSRTIAQRKVDTIVSHFATQRTRHSFTDDLFQAVMRVRGMESSAEKGLAEASYCRKLVVA